MKMTNSSCICTRRQSQEFCLLVHMPSEVCYFHMNFCTLSLHLNFCNNVHLYICNGSAPFKKKLIVIYFKGGFTIVQLNGVVCTEYFGLLLIWKC